MSGYLSRRQRMAPPIDRGTGRRGPSTGGIDQASPRTLAPGLENELTRYPGTVNDVRIVRDRGPYYAAPRYTPPAISWVNWTEAGPRRPELHVRQSSLREMVGNDRSRYPYVRESPTGGMHTMTAPGVARTVPRFVQTPQMVPGRIDRLAGSQYAGQTYSQTTRRQGR